MSKRTVVYIRISTDKQITDSQELAIKRWLKTSGEGKVITLTDTASGSKASRPAFNRLRNAIRKGQVKKVIVWRLSRIARNVGHLVQFLKLCIKNKVELISLTEKIDLTSAMGRAMVYIIGVFDELQREIISENTKLGMAAAKERNKDNPEWLHRQKLRKGLSLKRTRKLAPQVMDMLQKGEGVNEICRTLKIGKHTIAKIKKFNGTLPPNPSLVIGKK